jgi:membrane-bound inhibitor of C-type lysozyme
MKWLSGVSLALALALTASALAADEPKNSPYYPMADGTTWTYKAGDSKFTVKVTKHEVVQTSNCARFETIQDGKSIASEDVFMKDGSVYRLRSDDKLIDPPVLVLKQPAKPGDVWIIDSNTESKTSLRGTFKYGEEQITVAGEKDPVQAVTVHCDDLEANGAKYAFTTYYVKDKGMVKQVIDAGGLKVVIELEKYEAGGPAPK